MTYHNPTHTPACPGQTAHHRGSGGNYTHSILLKSAAAVLLLLLFCGVFCTAAVAHATPVTTEHDLRYAVTRDNFDVKLDADITLNNPSGV